ncbi:integrase catalytic domain-containing protein [Nephila pilipes]|uniref:Integrase catalytic domain-containing protein n=1 Tax=Nephila pilipes TaxID=299642 RepID=A0A8X6TFD9_NEPPI|nr:integrase catalytic domain-containing protein [Nephila pilipes]
MLRVTAWVSGFVFALKKKHNEKGSLTADELTNAELVWERIAQSDIYSNEITCWKNNKPSSRDSKLLCLSQFLDIKGILRVICRLGKSTHLSAFKKKSYYIPFQS